MRIIGIDCRTYFLRSGIGRYCRNVVNSMIERESGWRFVLWFSNQKQLSDIPIAADSNRITVSISQASLNDPGAEGTILREEIDQSAINLFFSPFNPIQGRSRIPSLLTVHDLTALLFPQWHDEHTVRYLDHFHRQSIREASGLIAVSTHTAGDIEKVIGPVPGQMRVIPLGVEPRFSSISAREISDMLAKYDLRTEGYVLFTGSIEPRKNHLRLLEAYLGSSLFGNVPLVLAGLPRWKSDAVVEQVGRSKFDAAVRMLGFVPDEDLPALYRGALFCVYPSLYEGFGLPVLEGMACGRAVLTSNVSSIPEVAGNAALLVDPMSVSDMRAALDKLAREPNTRAELGARGLERSRKFTWARTASDILEFASSLIQQ